MNDASNSLKQSQARLAHEFNTVLDDAQALLRHAAGEAGKGYAEARERLENSVRTARDRVETVEDMVLDSAREAGRSADGYVRSHPWEAIAVGAGIGLVIGILVSRR